MSDKNEEMDERTKRWTTAARSYKMASRMECSAVGKEEQARHDLIEEVASTIQEFMESPGGMATKEMLANSILYFDVLNLDEGNKLIFGFFGFAILPPPSETEDEEDNDEAEYGDDEDPGEDVPEPLEEPEEDKGEALVVCPLRYQEVADIIIDAKIAEQFPFILQEKIDELAEMAPKNN